MAVTVGPSSAPTEAQKTAFKAAFGLGSVNNTSDLAKPISTATVAALAGKQDALGYTPEDVAEKGQPGGYAGLDAAGKVPATHLPAYVDDVQEYATLSAFPAVGNTGVIYLAQDNPAFTYRWGGTVYVPITSGAVVSVAGKTGAVSLGPADVGLGSVDNTSDLAKPISTAVATALAAKQNALVSGTNIKTINNSSLLGVGNITIQGAVGPPGTVEVGDIILTARTLAAPDWLPADGGTYLQSSYPALFGVVGLLTGPWTQRTSSFGTTAILAVAYGGSQWVAVGNGGLLATSPDGVTWTQRTSSFGTTSIRALAYGGSQWVAVGNGGLLATSPDGVTWTQRTSSFGTTAIYAVAYGGGQWVAVSDSGTLATSPDGVTWTQRTSSFGTAVIFAVAYGGGQWVAVASSGKLATSPDGVTWTQRTSSFGTASIRALAYGGGQWVAVASSGLLATSPDGVTWTQRTSSFGTTAILAVAYGGSQWVAVGNSGLLATSPDGVTWTQRTSSFGATAIYAVAYGGGQWVAVGNSGTLATASYPYTAATQFMLPAVTNPPDARYYIKT